MSTITTDFPKVSKTIEGDTWTTEVVPIMDSPALAIEAHITYSTSTGRALSLNLVQWMPLDEDKSNARCIYMLPEQVEALASLVVGLTG